MSNEVSTNKVAGLAGLATGLRRTKSQMPSFGRKSFLQFGKDGLWTLGKDKRTGRNDERVLLNITSLRSGYVCWTNHPEGSKKKNEKLGEEMALATGNPIDVSHLPDTGWDWRQQQSVEGRFIGGDQEEFIFNTSSNGGLEAMEIVISAVMDKIDSGEDVYLFPIVELAGDWYDHSQYGKTHKPLLEVVAWCDAEGLMEGGAPDDDVVDDSDDDDEDDVADDTVDEEPTIKDEREEPPTRRRRRR